MNDLFLILTWPVSRLKEKVWYFTNPKWRSGETTFGFYCDVALVIMGIFLGVMLDGSSLPKGILFLLLYLFGLLLSFIVSIASDAEDKALENSQGPSDFESLITMTHRHGCWFLVIDRLHWAAMSLAIAIAMA